MSETSELIEVNEEIVEKLDSIIELLIKMAGEQPVAEDKDGILISRTMLVGEWESSAGE